MMDNKLFGLLPDIAKSEIDFKNNKIRFKYLEKNYEVPKFLRKYLNEDQKVFYAIWKVYLGALTSVIVFLLPYILGILIVYALFISSFSLVTKNTESVGITVDTIIKTLSYLITSILGAFITVFLFFLFYCFLAFLPSLYHYYVKPIPYLITFGPHLSDKWSSKIKYSKEFENLTKNKIVLPLFETMNLNWEATLEYETMLEKVEIIETPILCNDEKSYYLNVIFTFSDIPKVGKIKVFWW